MIVMKFGGTSTQDAPAVRNIAGIVKARLAERPFVVISAIAQATNALERAGGLASDGRAGEARDVLLNLIERHYAIADAIVTDSRRNVALRKTIAEHLAELEELVRGVTILRELTGRTLDSFYAHGELLSSRIVSEALIETGVDAVWLDTKDFMVTDENFTRALPVMELVTERLAGLAGTLLAEGKVPVTQGFIGVTPSGRRTTMGRESSDYSASIIGSALSAADVQIWTDVDGILTADPRIVADPRKVKELTFGEAYELSYFGAKVLHPNTMLPALEKNIPIHIFNSRRPESSGTRVSGLEGPGRGVVKSVASKDRVVLVTVTPKRRLSPFIFWEHINSILTKYGAVPAMTATSEYSIAVALESKSDTEAIARELAEAGEVRRIERQGIVCIVGAGIRGSAELVARVFRPIADVPVSMISYGASGSSLAFAVAEEHLAGVVRRIHAEFFDSLADDGTFEALNEKPPGA